VPEIVKLLKLMVWKKYRN